MKKLCDQYYCLLESPLRGSNGMPFRKALILLVSILSVSCSNLGKGSVNQAPVEEVTVLVTSSPSGLMVSWSGGSLFAEKIEWGRTPCKILFEAPHFGHLEDSPATLWVETESQDHVYHAELGDIGDLPKRLHFYEKMKRPEGVQDLHIFKRRSEGGPREGIPVR